MRVNSAMAALAALLLCLLPSAAAFYAKNSPVLQVDAKSYNKLIANSNYTSIVEFYAPWCGHCQNLKPAYEKAAKNLQGLAKVAAVNCDEEMNKPLCGQMGVKGFPTLKIVRPGKKPGKPVVEDYQGARAAKAIVDAVVDKIPNHVKRLTDKGIQDWLAESNATAKAILFTDKGTTSALWRALAIDYLGSISFAQIRDKEKQAVNTFGVTKFPTLLLLPGGQKDGLVYDGEMKKEDMSAFLGQVAPPNPDPAPEEPKKPKTDKKKDPKKFSQFDEASKQHKAEDASSEKLKATAITLESEGMPKESPHPSVDTEKPIKVDDEPEVMVLASETEVEKECLSPKSHICILALLPALASEDSIPPRDVTLALRTLGELHSKYSRRGSSIPYYSVPASNPKGNTIRETLDIAGEDKLEIIVTNAKRGWWRRYSGDGYGRDAIESWIDVIRMNEGPRNKIPPGLIAGDGSPAEDPSAADEPTVIKEPTKDEVPQAAPEAEPSPETDEEATREDEFPADPVPPTEHEDAAKEAQESEETKGSEKIGHTVRDEL